jgi:hypothetical protein
MAWILLGYGMDIGMFLPIWTTSIQISTCVLSNLTSSDFP